jgi:hypothetical protein
MGSGSMMTRATNADPGSAMAVSLSAAPLTDVRSAAALASSCSARCSTLVSLDVGLARLDASCELEGERRSPLSLASLAHHARVMHHVLSRACRFEDARYKLRTADGLQLAALAKLIRERHQVRGLPRTAEINQSRIDVLVRDGKEVSRLEHRDGAADGGIIVATHHRGQHGTLSIEDRG